jgi:hypothetical protein
MKKIRISDDEKNSILESHNKYRDVLMGHLFDKTLLDEQTQTGPVDKNPAGVKAPAEVIRMANQKCPTGSGPKLGEITKYGGQDAIKYAPAGGDPKAGVKAGEVIYFLGTPVQGGGLQYVVVTTTERGERIVSRKGTWGCPGLDIESEDCKKLIQGYKNRGYKEKKDLKDEELTNINNPKVMEAKPLAGCGVTLYRFISEEAKALSANQVAYLNGIYGLGSATKESEVQTPEGETVVAKWKLSYNATPLERQEWRLEKIGPNEYLDKEYTILLNPEGLKKPTTGTTVSDVLSRMKAEELSKSVCQDVINAFYTAYLRRDTFRLNDADFKELKFNAQKCSAQEFAFGLGPKTKKRLVALRGQSKDPDFPSVPQYAQDKSRDFRIR